MFLALRALGVNTRLLTDVAKGQVVFLLLRTLGDNTRLLAVTSKVLVVVLALRALGVNTRLLTDVAKGQVVFLALRALGVNTRLLTDVAKGQVVFLLLRTLGDNTRLLTVSPTAPLAVLEFASRSVLGEDTLLLAATYMVLLWTTAPALEPLQDEDAQLIVLARMDTFSPRLDPNLVVPRLALLGQQRDAFPLTLHPGNAPVNLLISRPCAGAA